MSKFTNNEGKLWNYDICLFDKTDPNNNATPFSKEVLHKIRNMSDEQRILIVDIKKAVTLAGLYLKGMSVLDMYLRVIEDGVKSVSEYMPYAEELARTKKEKPKSR